jgi:molybdopterin-containing oxidoreductase family iron-sulfur binding subunit
MKGRTDLAQPTINALYNSRYAQESFLRWSDNASAYYDYLRQTHNSGYVATMLKSDGNWNTAVHNGTLASSVAVASTAPVETTQDPAAVESAPAPSMNIAEALAAVSSAKGGEWEVTLYQTQSRK